MITVPTKIEPIVMVSSDLPRGFHVDLLFPDEYSDFIAQVYFKDRLVLVLSQEHGTAELEVEFATDVRGFPDRMPLKGLEDSIDYAKRRLFELGKEK